MNTTYVSATKHLEVVGYAGDISQHASAAGSTLISAAGTYCPLVLFLAVVLYSTIYMRIVSGHKHQFYVNTEPFAHLAYLGCFLCQCYS